MRKSLFKILLITSAINTLVITKAKCEDLKVSIVTSDAVIIKEKENVKLSQAEEEKTIFSDELCGKIILEAIRRGDNRVIVYNNSMKIDIEHINKIVDTIIEHNPEIFYLYRYDVSRIKNSTNFLIKFDYFKYSNKYVFDITDKDRIQEYTEKFNKELDELRDIISECESDLEKVECIFRYMNNTCTCLRDESTVSVIDRGMYGCVVNKKCESVGIARTISYLLTECNIDNEIHSNAKIDVGVEHITHYWNSVKINDEYYEFDASLNIQDNPYKAFLISIDEMINIINKVETDVFNNGIFDELFRSSSYDNIIIKKDYIYARDISNNNLVRINYKTCDKNIIYENNEESLKDIEFTINNDILTIIKRNEIINIDLNKVYNEDKKNNDEVKSLEIENKNYIPETSHTTKDILEKNETQNFVGVNKFNDESINKYMETENKIINNISKKKKHKKNNNNYYKIIKGIIENNIRLLIEMYSMNIV